MRRCANCGNELSRDRAVLATDLCFSCSPSTGREFVGGEIVPEEGAPSIIGPAVICQGDECPKYHPTQRQRYKEAALAGYCANPQAWSEAVEDRAEWAAADADSMIAEDEEHERAD